MRRRLKIEYNYDFGLLAISSPVRDYRLCWLLNKALQIDLVREEDVELTRKRKERRKTCFFSRFSYEDELTKSTINVLANRFSTEALIPELKKFDFLLLIDGGMHETAFKEIKEKVGTSPGIQLTMSYEPASLKSKINLVFWQ